MQKIAGTQCVLMRLDALIQIETGIGIVEILNVTQLTPMFHIKDFLELLKLNLILDLFHIQTL